MHCFVAELLKQSLKHTLLVLLLAYSKFVCKRIEAKAESYSTCTPTCALQCCHTTIGAKSDSILYLELAPSHAALSLHHHVCRKGLPCATVTKLSPKHSQSLFARRQQVYPATRATSPRAPCSSSYKQGFLPSFSSRSRPPNRKHHPLMGLPQQEGVQVGGQYTAPSQRGRQGQSKEGKEAVAKMQAF